MFVLVVFWNPDFALIVMKTYLLYTFKYTSVRTAWLLLHSFWEVASRVSDTFLDCLTLLKSKMQMCILFRREGRDEEVQREPTAPELSWASTCSLRSEFVTRFCVAPRCLGWRAFVCVKCSLTANKRFVWVTLKVYNEAATDDPSQIWRNLRNNKYKTNWKWCSCESPVSHSPLGMKNRTA